MAGRLDNRGPRNPPRQNPVEDMHNLYSTSVERQAGDYDDIMGRFRDIYGGASSPNGANGMYRFDPYSAAQTRYRQTRDSRQSLSELEDLSRTGGLSAGDQQNLRARAVSPIRAQYATAQRDMNRQRGLQGGNSANFGAVTARMTRDQSSLIADQMDNVNAGIAEMVQSGRLSAAPNYASAANAESSLRHGVASSNTAARNEASQHNASGLLQSRRDQRGDRLGAVQGMTNLYGTTPALSNLYGDQAHRSAEFQDRTNQRRKTNAMGALRSVYG